MVTHDGGLASVGGGALLHWGFDGDERSVAMRAMMASMAILGTVAVAALIVYRRQSRRG